jgi:hypothetical protein
MAMRLIPLCRIMRAPTGTKRGTESHYRIGLRREAKRGITDFSDRDQPMSRDGDADSALG